tara:strand:- start:689 stop:967 length:279 start_codon:yes stop_codon:yes gene_type:complete
MSGQKLTLLKFPHSTDEIIQERIASLDRLICEANSDCHVSTVIEMLIGHITLNYEGIYIDNMITRLIEAHGWWTECHNPNATLSVESDCDLD